MKPLTPKQQALLDWITAYINHNGYPASFEEMVVAMKLASKSPIQRRLNQLISKGYLEHTPGKARSIRPIQRKHYTLDLSGTIAAGGLVESFQETETLDFSHLLNDPTVFKLRVQGDSMVDAMIDHNDIVFMRPLASSNIVDGTIVAAKVEQETTLKYFYKKGRKIELRPANSNYQPMLLDAKTVEVQGVLVGVMRSL
jgi:repressor LexA